MSLPRSAPQYDDGLQAVYSSNLETALNGGGSDAHDKHEHAGVPYDTYVGETPMFAPDTPRRRVCGIPMSTFILAVALSVVIVAAGIGGGIGGSIAVSNAKQSCSTPTATSSSMFTAPTNVTLPLDCPGLEIHPPSSTFAHRTSTFEMYCGQTAVYEQDKAILSMTVYTLDACLQACVSFNHYVNADNCTLVEFYSNLTANPVANCFLTAWAKYPSLNSSSEGNHVVTGLINRS